MQTRNEGPLKLLCGWASLLLVASQSLGEAAVSLEAMRVEWGSVEEACYDALELAPVRRWGRSDLQEPLRKIQRALAGDDLHLDRASLVVMAEEAYDDILRSLLLSPAGTISWDEEGAPRFQPAQLDVVTYQDTPTALLLKVMPFGRSGKLNVTAFNGNGIKLEGQDILLTSHFSTYLVLPMVAEGNPGTRTISVKMTAAGRDISVPLNIEVRPAGRLRGRVVRKGEDASLAAKLYLEDEEGRLYVVPGERNYRTQSWYAFFQPRFSYVEGEFLIPLPPGKYRITAMKGYGYRNWEGLIQIEAGCQSECRIEMEQLCPLEEDGWYSADMHVHGRLTLPMLRAEDVNVAANCHYSSHRPMKLPVYKDSSDATHLSCSAQEIEHWNFGNAFYFGIPTTVQDPDTPDVRMTPFFHYDEQSHRMGGVNLRWLRSRPFSARGNGQQQPEIAVDAALGYMDIWSVMDNSMQNQLDRPDAQWMSNGWDRSPLYEHTYKTWYALLNCGLRITASAGTSYGRLSRLGFNRVYARCPHQPNTKAFAVALKKGDGFVTNGPLLWLRANGCLPGDGLALDSPAEVTITVDLYCRYPVELVEVLQNGRVVAEKRLTKFDGHHAWEQTLRVSEPCWLAARSFGAYKPRYPHSASHNHFAHTNPLLVTVQGKKPSSPKDAAAFLKEVDALIEFAPNIPTEELRSRSLKIFRKARQYFADMADYPLAGGEVSYPPALPGGEKVVTATSESLVKPPSSLKGVAVAKAAPTVDFMYYPGQSYKGNPWSNWGDGLVSNGKYYSSIGDHLAPEGNSYVYEYDPETKTLRRIVDVRDVLNLPRGHYTPGKIHGRIDMGDDGWLYFSTHRGSTRVTTDEYHYEGDWIMRHHPTIGSTEIVIRGPVGKQCIPCSVLDPNRMIFYGGTQAGDFQDKRNMFFAYDIKGRTLLYSGYDGPARYMIFAASTGRVYFTPGLAGALHRFDPEEGGSPVRLSATMGLRAATQETPEGYVYAVSTGDGTLWRLNTRTEQVEELGHAPVGSQTYITTLDADASGRYVYYIPGAHGGSEKDGAAVVQFDVKMKKRKVIAFLHPFLKDRYGYTPLGTFSSAIAPRGDKLYVTWNGNLGGTKGTRLTWDACALTVIHIPESERRP